MRRTIISTVLSSSLLFTAAAYASPPPADSAAPTLRVSTGITPPKLLNSIDLAVPDSVNVPSVPSGTQVSLSYTVDEKGQPRNIQVVKGYNFFWNARVVSAVSQLHYRPATMDNQAIPMDINLTVTLAH